MRFILHRLRPPGTPYACTGCITRITVSIAIALVLAATASAIVWISQSRNRQVLRHAITPGPVRSVAVGSREGPPIEEAMISALARAKQDARAVANAELRAWQAELLQRVDTDFLPWLCA